MTNKIDGKDFYFAFGNADEGGKYMTNKINGKDFYFAFGDADEGGGKHMTNKINGKDFYFAFGNADEGGKYMSIVSKEYWKQRHCVEDKSFDISHLIPYFHSEDMESLWFLYDTSEEQVRQDMEDAGFEYSDDFADFLDKHPI